MHRDQLGTFARSEGAGESCKIHWANNCFTKALVHIFEIETRILFPDLDMVSLLKFSVKLAVIILKH